MFFPGAVRSGAEIAAASQSPGMLSASLTLALFLSPVCRRLYSPGALATDLESVDYTCSLVAIIRRMTQRLSMGEGWRVVRELCNGFGRGELGRVQ